MYSIKLVIAGYLLPLVLCYFAWGKAKSKIKVFQAVWVFGIMFMLNAYGLMYAVIYSESVLPLGLSLEKYYIGSVINLVFILLWGIGYWIGVKKNIVLYYDNKKKRKVTRVGIWTLRALILVSGISTLIFYSMGISYGVTVFDYSSLPVYFGPIAAFKNLLIPTVAAYLILLDDIRVQGYSLQICSVEKLLWFLIALRIVAGLTLDMQRGDIVNPVLITLIIIVVKRYVVSRNKILASVSAAAIVIIFVSPILDILRQPEAYNKNISIENVTTVIDKVSESNESGLLSLSTIMYVPYSKAILPSSTYALTREVKENGNSFFSTYDDPILDMVPRFVWPDKPWPLSVDGKNRGTAAGLAAENLGDNNIIWVIGGGTMYWHFGWIGVILGGIIVGFLWGQITQKMLLSSSPFLIIVFFSIMGWGIHYLEGIDKLILKLFRSARALLLIWIPISIIVNVLNNKK